MSEPGSQSVEKTVAKHRWSLWFKAAKESATDTLPEGGPYALTMDGETGVMSPIDESVEKM